MRKSDKIILSLVFLAAVNSSKTFAQDFNANTFTPDLNAPSRDINSGPSDSSSHRGYSHGGAYSHGSWFGRMFHRGGQNAPQAPRPKTGGFGTTVRPLLRSAGS